jgi:hypothetical protein
MASDVTTCANCQQPARKHDSGLCHDCRWAKTTRRRAHSNRRVTALERHARLVYDTDRDVDGEFSQEA